MSITAQSNKSWIAGVFVAIAASLCCIMPIVALAGGLGGAVSAFGWIEPYRPYLLGTTAALFGFAWYQKLKPQMTVECDCAAEKNTPFLQSKSFLGLSTTFAALMVTFPYYTTIFHAHTSGPHSTIIDSNNLQHVRINIEGMTCDGCAEEINNELSKVRGVVDYRTSFESQSTVVTFDRNILPVENIVRAVRNTSYTVTSYHIVPEHSRAMPGDPNENISFYAVPLVCGADSTIGCGSRSKPALLELEQHPLVKEAWLNRQGTVLAIVWKDKVQESAIVKPIFDRNMITFTELNDEDTAPYRQSFRKSGLWYRGAEVDRLSIEEAGTIAESAVQFAREHKLVSLEEADRIKSDIQRYFTDELVKIRTNDQLNYDSEHTFMEAIYRILEKHIGKDRTMKAIEFYQEYSEEEREQDGGCEGQGSKKDCCNK